MRVGVPVIRSELKLKLSQGRCRVRAVSQSAATPPSLIGTFTVSGVQLVLSGWMRPEMRISCASDWSCPIKRLSSNRCELAARRVSTFLKSSLASPLLGAKRGLSSSDFRLVRGTCAMNGDRTVQFRAEVSPFLDLRARFRSAISRAAR